MICSALVFAADMFAGLTEVEAKRRRRNEMLGNCFVGCRGERGLMVLIEKRGNDTYQRGIEVGE